MGGSHQREDTRNCRVYVTYIVMITFSMFLFQLGTLSAAIFLLLFCFCFVIVLSFFCENCVRIL